MLETAPFQPEHLLLVDVQHMQLYESAPSIERGRQLAQHFAISGWIDGRCVGCAGIVPKWDGHAFAWALLSGECGKHMLAVTRAIREALDLYPARRIETTVMEDFPEGRRWAELLGFECETPKPMRYFREGRGAWLYARIRG